MQTTAPQAGIEISGRYLRLFITHAPLATLGVALGAHDVADIQDDAWYPLAQWLAALEAATHHAPPDGDLTAIGAAIAASDHFAPEAHAADPAAYFQQLAADYAAHHRNGAAGAIRITTIAPGHLHLRLDLPYPAALTYGVVYGLVRRLFRRHDYTVVRAADRDANRLDLHIFWE